MKDRLSYFKRHTDREDLLGIIEKYKASIFFASTMNEIDNTNCFYPDHFDITESIITQTGNTNEMTNIEISEKILHALDDAQFDRISTRELKKLAYLF